VVWFPSAQPEPIHFAQAVVCGVSLKLGSARLESHGLLARLVASARSRFYRRKTSFAR
jgi:hypothetical protein